MKKTRIALVGLLAAAFLQQGAMAATLPLQKTELMNVAEYKPLTRAVITDYDGANYPFENLVDGDRGTFVLLNAYTPGGYVQVDLLKRFKIEKIELFDRYDTSDPESRQHIEIYGSNDAAFGDGGTLLGSIGSVNDAVFPENGKLEINLDGTNAYRYVRIVPTSGLGLTYSELRVWAPQTATEVSRGKTAIADDLNDGENSWTYAGMEKDKALDGDTSTLWLEDGAAYRYYRVDLGEAYNIGLIEMAARDFGGAMDDFWSRTYINIFGSNSGETGNAVLDPAANPTLAEASALGFTKLTGVGANNVYASESSFPAVSIPTGSEATNGNAGYFQSTCDDTNAYRYITYKKTIAGGAALSTFAAYVINPVVNSAELSGMNVRVNFSDEMDATTFTAAGDNVKVYVNDQLNENVVLSSPDAYTLNVALDRMYYGSRIRVELSDGVKNTKNVSVAGEKTITVDAPPAIEIQQCVVQNDKDSDGSEISTLGTNTEVGVKVKMKNNTADITEQAVVLTVLYDANNTIIKAKESRVTLLPGANPTIYCGVDRAADEGTQFKAFVWKDFNLMNLWHIHKVIR